MTDIKLTVEKIAGMRMLADGIELILNCADGQQATITVGAKDLISLAEAVLAGSYYLHRKENKIAALSVQDVQTRQLQGGAIAVEAAIGNAQSATYLALPLDVAKKLRDELDQRIASVTPPAKPMN